MYAKINGVDLFFDIAGKQYVPDGSVMKKKPVCFVLHGGPGCSHYHFLPSFLALADSMQLVFIDHRGCGLSGKAPVETYSMEQNADDAEALRQYLGLGKIFLLGMSYGGFVAQKYALKYQEHLQGLILCSTCPSYRYFETSPIAVQKLGTPEQVEYQKRSRAKYQKRTADDMRESFRVMGSLYHYNYDKQAVEEATARAIYSPEVSMHQRSAAGDLRDFNYLPELHKITVPTLVLGAEQDHITPIEHTYEIANAIKHAEVIVISESGHEIGDDHPEITFPAIRDFVARNDK